MSLQGLGKMVSLSHEVTIQFAAHVLRRLGETPIEQSWARDLLESEGLWEQGVSREDYG